SSESAKSSATLMERSTPSRIIRASVTAGGRPIIVMHDLLRRGRVLWQSLATKLILLLLVFATVPIILYSQFRAADTDKNALLYRSVQEEGRLVTEALAPLVEAFQARSAARLSEALVRLGGDRINIKLLFQPSGVVKTDSFFYIASN